MLPDSFTQLKNGAKTVTEIIPCYYRYFNRIKVLCRGEKPNNIASNKPITKREWESSSKKMSWKNPIKEGQKYLDCLKNNPDFRYRDVADEYGVSKARISQMIALAKRLPKEILNFFYKEIDPEELKYFTERKLRPLTILNSDEEKIESFCKIKNHLYLLQKK